jgi:hypothetical protein
VTEPRRWLAVGRADRSDPDAAAAAARDALLHENPKLLIVFCSDAFDLTAAVKAIDNESGGVPLIGCSTAGEIATSGPGDSSIVVTALGGDGFHVTTAQATNAGSRLREAGAEAAACLECTDEHEHRVLLLLTDGLAGDQQEIVRGAHGVLGAGVPLVGGCAGDDLKMERTFQFHGSAVLTDAVVAAGICSDSPFGIGVRHGWRKVGEPMLVTASSDGCVDSLDGQPALDVYLDRLDAPAEARADQSAFTRFALTHPLGMSRRRGEEQVRFIGGADFTKRSLSTIAAVPQGALVWLMEGDDDSVLIATDDACDHALESLGDKPPIGVLAFDCIARRGVLGDEGIRTEIDRVAAGAGGAAVAGFYTYGEIARTRGVTGFHNQTLVVLAVS